jgi:hypothetical protein
VRLLWRVACRGCGSQPRLGPPHGAAVQARHQGAHPRARRNGHPTAGTPPRPGAQSGGTGGQEGGSCCNRCEQAPVCGRPRGARRPRQRGAPDCGSRRLAGQLASEPRAFPRGGAGCTSAGAASTTCATLHPLLASRGGLHGVLASRLFVAGAFQLHSSCARLRRRKALAPRGTGACGPGRRRGSLAHSCLEPGSCRRVQRCRLGVQRCRLDGSAGVAHRGAPPPRRELHLRGRWQHLHRAAGDAQSSRGAACKGNACKGRRQRPQVPGSR